MKKKILLIPLGGTIAAKVPDRKSPIYLSGQEGIATTLAGLKDLDQLIDFQIEPLLENDQVISCHSSSLKQSSILVSAAKSWPASIGPISMESSLPKAPIR